METVQVRMTCFKMHFACEVCLNNNPREKCHHVFILCGVLVVLTMPSFWCGVHRQKHHTRFAVIRVSGTSEPPWMIYLPTTNTPKPEIPIWTHSPPKVDFVDTSSDKLVSAVCHRHPHAMRQRYLLMHQCLLISLCRRWPTDLCTAPAFRYGKSYTTSTMDADGSLSTTTVGLRYLQQVIEYPISAWL